MYVARFTCSTLRRPPSSAAATSATVWSRCRSTKPRVDRRRRVPVRPVVGGHRPRPSRRPRATVVPRRGRTREPLVVAEPPPIARQSWRAGFQPPRRASRSHSIGAPSPSGPLEVDALDAAGRPRCRRRLTRPGILAVATTSAPAAAARLQDRHVRVNTTARSREHAEPPQVGSTARRASRPAGRSPRRRSAARGRRSPGSRCAHERATSARPCPDRSLTDDVPVVVHAECGAFVRTCSRRAAGGARGSGPVRRPASLGHRGWQRPRLGETRRPASDDQRLDRCVAMFHARRGTRPAREASNAGEAPRATNRQPGLPSSRARRDRTTARSTSTNAFGSSGPAVMTPRGRRGSANGSSTRRRSPTGRTRACRPRSPRTRDRRRRTTAVACGRSTNRRRAVGRHRAAPPRDPDLVGRVRRGRGVRVARSNHPATAVDVVPAFGPPALRVVAQEQEVGPLLVGQDLGIGRVGEPGLAAVAELDLVARPAPRARDQQHRGDPYFDGDAESRTLAGPGGSVPRRRRCPCPVRLPR